MLLQLVYVFIYFFVIFCVFVGETPNNCFKPVENQICEKKYKIKHKITIFLDQYKNRK